PSPPQLVLQSSLRTRQLVDGCPQAVPSIDRVLSPRQQWQHRPVWDRAQAKYIPDSLSNPSRRPERVFKPGHAGLQIGVRRARHPNRHVVEVIPDQAQQTYDRLRETWQVGIDAGPNARWIRREVKRP